MLGTKRDSKQHAESSDDRDQPLTKEQLSDELAKAGTLEANMLREVLDSRRNARRLAVFTSVLAAAGIAVAGLTIYRYAQPIPAQLLTIDPQTNIVEPTRIAESAVSYGEAIDKGNLARYVRARESYDYFQQQLNYDITRLMSSNTAFSPFRERYAGDDGLAEQWGDTRVIRVEITSIMLHDGGTAVVRYKTQLQQRDRSLPDPAKNHIATLSYAYPDRVMQADERYLNPLGFLVTSWESQIEAVGR